MKTLDELKLICEEFQSLLEVPFSKDDADACLERMTELEVVMAQSGQYLADAKYWQDKAQGRLKQYVEELGSEYTASTLNNYVKAKTLEENHLVNALDRVNATSTHQLSNIRTAISYQKELMRNLNYRA
jgi:hypothetical protein